MTTEYVYIVVRQNGKWFNQGAFTAENISVAYDEAVSLYGADNVQTTYDPKAIDALNREYMVGQMKSLGQKFTTGLGTITKRMAQIESRARVARERTPTARTFDRQFQPPKPHRPSIGMMPPPSDYAKMEQQERPQQRHFTKYGRPLKPVNIFRDSRYTASYLSHQQRNAMQYRRRRRY